MAEFYVHTATVEKFLGETGYGVDTFAPPVVLSPNNAPANGVFADDSRRLVRNKDGEQVVSETTLYTYPAAAPYFTPDSKVTIDGKVSRVIKTNLNTSGDLDLPDHLAVTLT